MKTEVSCDVIDVDFLTNEQIKAIASAIRKQTRKLIKDAKSNLKSEGAVKTGSLLNSIKAKVKQKKGKVYAVVGIDNKYTATDENGNRIRPAKYAPLVEYGSKHAVPTFFFTKAINQNRKAIIEALKQAVIDAL